MFATLILATGCNRQAAATAAPPPPVVTVVHPVMTPVQVYYEYNGTLEAVEMVEVRARVKGFLNEVAFTEGEEVEQGDLLFKIDPREYLAAVKRAEADRRQTMAILRHAQLEEARGRELLASAALSEQDFESRVATRETAQAGVMQAEAALEAAQLQLGFTEIYSPVSGQISRALVTRGNLVGQTENTLLTTIVSMDPLYVYFDAPERDLVEYQRALQAGEAEEVLSQSLPLEVGVATEEGFPHAGAIDFRENRVDVGTGTVRIRGRIPNPRVPPGDARLLYPGLYARVRVPSGGPRSLPAIPEDALMTGQEGRFVYVLGPDNTVLKRSVTVGPQVWKAPLAEEQDQVGWIRQRQDPADGVAAENAAVLGDPVETAKPQRDASETPKAGDALEKTSPAGDPTKPTSGGAPEAPRDAASSTVPVPAIVSSVQGLSPAV
ncbi:MAG: efflux RND transporter periplasmic adaptor subunit, partial [Pirellulaceae bacterium]